MSKSRKIYFDYLRVVAIMAVIVLHAAAQNWWCFSGRSYEWQTFNLYNSISRWGVPVSLMISGALFLSREVDIKKLYSKYILRMIIAYGVWAFFYAIITECTYAIADDSYAISYRAIIVNTIRGADHMWFIPMIVGLYMCVPVIKQIVSSKEITKYFLALSFVFACVIPQVEYLSKDFGGELLATGVEHVGGLVSDLGMELVLGYTLFFVLGYVLDNVELTKKQRHIVYVLGGVGFVSTILLNAVVAWKTDTPCQTYYYNFNVNVILEAVAIFVWFKYRAYENEKVNQIVVKLSKCSFGVYLVHIFVQTVFDWMDFNTVSFHPMLSVPVLSVIVIVISFGISYVLNKIPVINKWLV